MSASVHAGIPHPPSRHPPEQTPSGADTPQSRHHPPEQTHPPPRQTPREQTSPLGADTPPSRHAPPKWTPPGADTPRSRHPPGADTPLPRSRHPPPRKQTPAYGQWAAGRHPTGMHSCFLMRVLYTLFLPSPLCGNLLNNKQDTFISLGTSNQRRWMEYAKQ